MVIPERIPESGFNKTLLVLGCCGLAISCGNIQTATKPNIIFIMSDDHAYQALSAYSDKLIQTPNIDRIAREGVLFQKAFVTNSISGPSRAVILTGKYSHLNGFKDNDNSIFNGEQQTLPKILRENGYATAVVGKWHLGSIPTGFDFWDILPGQGHYYNPEFINMGRDTVYNGYVTDIITDHAIDWMRQKRSKPFFIMLHNKAPHRNWMPPLEYMNEFNNLTFPLPENFNDKYENRLALQRQRLTVAGQLSVTYDSKVPCDTCIEDKVNHWAKGEWEREYGRLSPEQKEVWDRMMKVEKEEFSQLKSTNERTKWQFQRYMEDYLRCIKSVDDNVGKVLDFLKDSGLDKNTIVVYTSDQGFYLGEHGLYDKRFMYEESFRTPLIIYNPHSKTKGISNSDLVINIDYAPTILDLAGIKVPEDMQGVSMKPLIDGEKDPEWRKELYYHYYEKSYGMSRHYGIRTDKYKLIHYYDPVDSWELYDLQVDPAEMSNLIDFQNLQNVVADLKIRLKKLQEKYKDDMQGETHPQAKKPDLQRPESYEATWNSLTKHPYPEWFQDAKFGIYFHWGVYSVPAYGSEWYPRWMYIDTLIWGTQFYDHHVKTYGKPDKFGYKDFIPMFKAEKFDADEWADLFKRSGAKFAGPVAEHADGFSMWDSRLNHWNAKNMGPERDIVGELETAIRKKGMNFIATFHHQWEWGWYPTWDTLTDCSNPEYAGLYGPRTLPGAFNYGNPNPAPGLDWFQLWKNKTIEVITKYKPDLVWFDSRLSFIPDSIKRNLLAFYYNKGLEWNQEVSVTYKVGELPANSAILDIEKGAMADIETSPWLTDASIDDASWCYNLYPKYKTSQKLIDYLITIVSKNGQLLLNIPPKPDGTIPDEVKSILLDIGGWLAVNGEAIYGTRPWIKFGEGPTEDGKGDFNDKIPAYTPKDIRFTTKGDTLFALLMAIPADRKVQITSLPAKNYNIKSVELVGTSQRLKFSQNTGGMVVELPELLPSKFALALRITQH